VKHNLSEIANGQSVIVREIEASDLKVKLMEMGLVSGKNLRVLYRAPFGDPMAVDVEGYVLSLRMEEAKLVGVEIPELSV
jgi:ferrous iron transport protein A